MDKSWLGWVEENLRRGCDPGEILGILLEHKFALSEIRAAMGGKFPASSPLLGGFPLAPSPAGIDYRALSQVRITRSESGARRVESDLLQLYVLDDFMNDEECDELVRLATPSLRPSTISVYVEGYRTSKTSDLALLKHPFVKKIDEKIARAIGIQLPYSEGIQAQKYEVGQEFKPHTDYFQPRTKEYEEFASKMGNRTWTFMIYLNDTPKGGGTQMVNIHQTFTPNKGRALIWNNLYADGSPNPDTLHWGMPVEEGEKIIITKWFREKGTGPMFYE